MSYTTGLMSGKSEHIKRTPLLDLIQKYVPLALIGTLTLAMIVAFVGQISNIFSKSSTENNGPTPVLPILPSPTYDPFKLQTAIQNLELFPTQPPEATEDLRGYIINFGQTPVETPISTLPSVEDFEFSGLSCDAKTVPGSRINSQNVEITSKGPDINLIAQALCYKYFSLDDGAGLNKCVRDQIYYDMIKIAVIKGGFVQLNYKNVPFDTYKQDVLNVCSGSIGAKSTFANFLPSSVSGSVPNFPKN